MSITPLASANRAGPPQSQPIACFFSAEAQGEVLEMSRPLSYPFCCIWLVLLLITPPAVTSGESSHSVGARLHDMSDPPVNVTEWRLQITEMNGRLDLMVDIIYSYNFTDDERLTIAALFRSLDNESFVQARKCRWRPASI
jgi:hypothetical protein